jgi:PAS domain S-box-containing protein
MRKKISRLYLRYSIWLTASSVIILIILLALTIYYVRERAIIELFSAQQASIAGQSATRIEESVAKCEKGMIMLSKLLSDQDVQSEKRREHIKALYDELQGTVLAIIEIDKNDTAVNGYPDNLSSKIYGKKLDDDAISHAMKKLNQRYTGEISLFKEFETNPEDHLNKTIGIGLPIMNKNNEYNGAIIAVVPPQLILGRTMPLNQIYINDFWLVDESGKVVFHPNKDMRVYDLQELTPEGSTSFKMFSYNSKRYSDLLLYQKDNKIRCIIAYAPIHIGIAQWWIVLVTPYDKVIKPIRSASFNIIFWAIGLIAVVIITAISIGRSDVKRMRLREELKRLREREEWQGKLLREKMTIDGIIEGSPVPTFVLNKDHKVILWNRACTDLTGHSSQEMINTSDYYKPFYENPRPFLADFILDHNIHSFDEFYGEGRVKKSESIDGAYEAVKYFSNIRGKERYLHFLAAPIFDEKGEIVAAIETFLDVSKEVELTKNLQEYAENLQNELGENIKLRKEVEELYNYLHSIIESLPDKVFDLNKDGIINFVSRRINKGHSDEDDPEGKHFTEYVAPEHRDYVISKWEDAKKGIFNPYELEMVTRKGVKRNLLLTPSPVKGSDRFVLVQRDITELKELEKKYYESQKLAAIGQLSAGIAHEVRNPLSSIKMSLQILEKRMQPEGNDLKRFKIAQREVEHLEKLVSDVLIYAKPSNPHKEPSDILSIIERALEMVEKSLTDKEIDVQKIYPEDMEKIFVDPAMIKQALINIFHNAVDAMEPKGKLTITLKHVNESLVIEIADTGSGIDEADLPHLFNPFFTRKNYGTGLGLTQVKKIIDQHDGEIEIQSKKGEGTRFIITLPKGSEKIRLQG